MNWVPNRKKHIITRKPQETPSEGFTIISYRLN